MKPVNTLNEANKYLLYISDALYGASNHYGMTKEEKVKLVKYAEDLHEYAKAIDQINSGLIEKEKAKKKKIELVNNLEQRYWQQKRITDRALLSEAIAKENLKKIAKSGNDESISKAKEYLSKLSKQYSIEKQREDIMKREFDQEGL